MYNLIKPESIYPSQIELNSLINLVYLKNNLFTIIIRYLM